MTLSYYLNFFFLSLFILIFGIVGCFLKKRNLLLILITIEIMLISVQLNFIISSYYYNDINGLIYNLFILMVAAAEVAIV